MDSIRFDDFARTMKKMNVVPIHLDSVFSIEKNKWEESLDQRMDLIKDQHSKEMNHLKESNDQKEREW